MTKRMEDDYSSKKFVLSTECPKNQNYHCSEILNVLITLFSFLVQSALLEWLWGLPAAEALRR